MKTKRRLFNTTTARVAFWYTALFSLSSLGLFGISYFYLHSTLGRLTDAELVETASELRHLYQESGMEALRSELQREAKSWGQERAFFILRNAHGEAIASSDLKPWGNVPPLASTTFQAEADEVQMGTLGLPDRSANIRLVTMPIGDGISLQIGEDLQDNVRIMREFRRAFLAALAIMLACGAAVGFLVARRAMSGVRKMALVASHIGKDNLQKRVPLEARSQEIDDLARAFNAMLE
ncbi:MAG: HAMP domain-containing protein, partial [Candidatus Dadabacteria bacterium]